MSAPFAPLGFIRSKVEVLVVRRGASTLTATGAATVKTCSALGYNAIVEEFGFDVEDALAGAGGTQDYTLKNGTHSLATITVTLALGVAGGNIKTTTITKTGNWHMLQDASVLTVVRVTGGTAFTSGTGAFYVRLAQRTQK